MTDYTDDRFVTRNDIATFFGDFAAPNEEAFIDFLFKQEIVWFEQETQTFVLSTKWPEMVDEGKDLEFLRDFEESHSHFINP